MSVTKPGYQTLEADVEAKRAGSSAGTLAGSWVLGGLSGMLIDVSSGAMNILTPNPLEVSLKPLEDGHVAAAPIVSLGESFHYETFKAKGEKVPLDGLERLAHERLAKKAKKKAQREKEKAIWAARKKAAAERWAARRSRND